MARALWKGSIAFGLVNIPVELHTAVRDSRPRFRMLHAEDKSPVRFERVCAREGKPVAWEDLVKGYEYEKGRFVVLTREDFRTAALEVAGDAMVLTLMRYAEELVDVGEYRFPTAKDVRKPELQMARTLVENLADRWDPSQYTDEYRANLMKIIKAKLKGREPHLVEHIEPRNAEVVDLMERLRQSLQGAGKKSAARRKKTTARGRRRAHAA